MRDSYHRAYEYESSVNPDLPPIPFSSKNHKDCLYGFTKIDLSTNYRVSYKATSPNLLAGFIKLRPNASMLYLNTHNNTESTVWNANSNLFYLIEGKGELTMDRSHNFLMVRNEIVVSPYFKSLMIKNHSSTDLILYYVNDSPLYNYLGAVPRSRTFRHCHYTNEFIEQKMKELSISENNRNGILLGNADTERFGTKTITHTMWALYNQLPPNTKQRIHRHNSVAIDYCVYSPDETKVYTLIGDEIDAEGNILHPVKMPWKTGEVFITPPGLWHSHHNETDEVAYVLPVQDAGLLLYQRILGISLY
jgi:gentisate 1,2-dioxygenase